MKISVLGMGRMGVALAARLAEGGHDVTVWNRSAGKAGPALVAGAAEAGSIEEAVSTSEVTITMLAADEAVRTVALGDGGVRASLPAGAVYVDSSTISPETSAELAGRFDRFVAMPVLGGPDAVRSGSAVFLAGAPAEALEMVEPVTAALTEKLTRFDSAALALAAKVTANFLLLGGLATLAEAFEMGRAGGLDDDQLRAVFGESPLVAAGVRNRFEGVLTKSVEGWFPMMLGAKDARLGVEVARRAGLDLAVAATVHRQFEAASSGSSGSGGSNGSGGELADADVAAIGRLYRA